MIFKGNIKNSELLLISKPKSLNNRIYRDWSNNNLNSNLSNEIFEKILSYLTQEVSVGAILCQKTEDILHIWTALTNFDDENNRRKVYKLELSLMKDMKNLNQIFNFQLIRTEEVDDIVSSGGILLFKR